MYHRAALASRRAAMRTRRHVLIPFSTRGTRRVLCVLYGLLLDVVASRSRRFLEIEGIKTKFVSFVADVAHRRDQAHLPPPNVFVLDVGANAGTFSQSMLRRLHNAAPRVNPRLIVFEPQEQFRASLSKMIKQSDGGELVAAAAWIEETNLTFHLFKNSESASLVSSSSDAASSARTGAITVRAVDLAEYLRHTLPDPSPSDPNATLAFLKLDIEGGEYDVLPRLLGTRALCRVRFLLIEWHLKKAPLEKRVAGLHILAALRQILESSCRPGPAPVVVYDEMPMLNDNVTLPGDRRVGDHHELVQRRGRLT